MTRVLLVEDSDDILFILQLELDSMGYTVDIAHNASEAIELAKANRPDVIVSDLNMPEIDGFEFLRRARQIAGLATVPAIAMTGFSRQKEVQQAIAAGFTAHQTKPVDASHLASVIAKLASVRMHRKAS